MSGYLGAKREVFPRIMGQMPVHDSYIEGCLGSGQVIRLKPAARVNLGVEVDPAVIEQFAGTWPEHVIIMPGSVFDLLDQLHQPAFTAPLGRILLYLDPPYHPDTRTSRHGYDYDWTHDDHVRLLEALRNLPPFVSVMLSGYPHPLYDQILNDWRCIAYQTQTRGGVRTECLWMNFEPGTPFWAPLSGDDADERWRVKKKAVRWAKNLADMPEAEAWCVLQACLDAMAEKYGS